MPLYKFLLALAPRVSSFFYWILDTLIVMGKIKVLPNLDVKWVSYRWALFWNFTNLMNIINAIVELVELSKLEARIMIKRRELGGRGKVQNLDGS